MYCSSCGVAVNPGSSYCNYCGEKLSGTKTETISESPEVRPGSLIGAMVFTFVFGLGAIAILLGMMKAVLHLADGQILAFAGLSFFIMLSLETVFTSLLLRRKRGARQTGDSVTLPGPATSELDYAHARALPEPRPSVTEHTTRAFDPSYAPRTSK